MLMVYGIKNCDTVRKALKWLDAQGIHYVFHDLRADGLTADKVKRWVDALGWESVLNRASATWRKLPDADKESLDALTATHLMVRCPTLVKRPVFEGKRLVLNGFSDEVRAMLVSGLK
jgi:Spx/MgsR family transcriptional regulator